MMRCSERSIHFLVSHSDLLFWNGIMKTGKENIGGPAQMRLTHSHDLSCGWSQTEPLVIRRLTHRVITNCSSSEFELKRPWTEGRCQPLGKHQHI